MSSAKALRVCTQVLVLLNLVFVQMTEAAGMHALIPLYALTLGAPFLQRLAGNRGYLTAWNLLVMGTFGILIWSVARGDLGNVLEYGLILAVLCQVHLLNNLRSDQRPDLLFFNAFLIAVVAGYINRGSTFGIVFLAFVPAFIIGLQLLTATGTGVEPSPRATARLLRDGALRSGVLLAASMLVFVFWPRNFERKAFFHGHLDFTSNDDADASVGFTDILSHRKRKSVQTDNAPALRISIQDGDATDLAGLWRGALLGTTDGSIWEPLHPRVLGQRGESEPAWELDPEGWIRHGAEPESTVTVQVQRLDKGTRYAFVPANATRLRTSLPGNFEPKRDGTIQSQEQGALSYTLTLDSGPAATPGGSFVDGLPRELGPYVALPRSRRIESARQLAERLAPDAQQVDQHTVVQRLANHLRETHTYLPPGSPDSPESLAAFLDAEGGGHCELFASALATMLRSLRIPCRIATGYRGADWDPANPTLTLALRDAHAWVEVHDPNVGWISIDPTPPAVFAEQTLGLLARTSASIRAAWNAITGFDEEARAELFAWARTVPGRGARAIRRHPLAGTALVLAFAAVILWFRRGGSQDPAAVRDYRSALAQAKLQPQPGETPRELLERARQGDLEPVSLARLRSATEAHERQRYAQIG